VGRTNVQDGLVMGGGTTKTKGRNQGVVVKGCQGSGNHIKTFFVRVDVVG
jgi:hypothetical protein